MFVDLLSRVWLILAGRFRCLFRIIGRCLLGRAFSYSYSFRLDHRFRLRLSDNLCHGRYSFCNGNRLGLYLFLYNSLCHCGRCNRLLGHQLQLLGRCWRRCDTGGLGITGSLLAGQTFQSATLARIIGGTARGAGNGFSSFSGLRPGSCHRLFSHLLPRLLCRWLADLQQQVRLGHGQLSGWFGSRRRIKCLYRFDGNRGGHSGHYRCRNRWLAFGCTFNAGGFCFGIVTFIKGRTLAAGSRTTTLAA